MQTITERRQQISTLAKASLEQLEQQVVLLGKLPNYDFLRSPEVGLAMVEGRAGGAGQPFCLGEMTLTRCVVRLKFLSEEGAIAGYGYVSGRSHRHAELAALCDALLQHSDWRSIVQSTVIEPLQVAAQQRRDQQERQVEATRVNFFHSGTGAVVLTTSIPGFQDGVHDAQKTFRTLLEALARPGRVEAIAISINPPSGLTSACAAACLTLLDLETRVWLQPGQDAAVASWLVFHTGCRFTQKSQQSDFALIWDVAALPDLTTFSWGTAEYPEASTTLLIQTERLSQGESIVLRGPGILHEQAIAPQLPSQFWQQWRTNYQSYPQGIDVFLFAQHDVMGLPRTTEIVGS